MVDFGLLVKNFCSVTDVPTSKSPEGIFWQILLPLKEYWPYILIGIAFIVIVELLTRHKNEYNSANGFTPEFNRLVGSLSYMVLQVLVYFAIKLIVGDVAYCMPWPYILHASVFSLNFAILHGIGFWPEKKQRKPKKWSKKRY